MLINVVELTEIPVLGSKAHPAASAPAAVLEFADFAGFVDAVAVAQRAHADFVVTAMVEAEESSVVKVSVDAKATELSAAMATEKDEFVVDPANCSAVG